MAEKLLNLFVFATLLAILFLGCRADADIIPNPEYNAEYSSKSLWKEDEIYVKNVKEIFDKQVDFQKFSINYGVPMWDYATTFGHFDESFVMAPLLNESTVMGVIIATRIKDKVYFKYSTDIAAIVFFHNLLFPRNSKIRAENQLQESSKLIGIEYKRIIDSFMGSGKSDDDVMDLVMAAMIYKFDIGIALSKADANGDFQNIFVKELKDPNDPNKITYEKTTDCNLK